MKKSEREKEERAQFLAESKRIKEDDEYCNKKLIEYGYDPEKLAQEGRNFLKSLFKKEPWQHSPKAH